MLLYTRIVYPAEECQEYVYIINKESLAAIFKHTKTAGTGQAVSLFSYSWGVVKVRPRSSVMRMSSFGSRPAVVR